MPQERLDKISQLVDELEELRSAEMRVREHRDALILQADEAKISREAIRHAAGVTRQAISLIIKKRIGQKV